MHGTLDIDSLSVNVCNKYLHRLTVSDKQKEMDRYTQTVNI